MIISIIIIIIIFDCDYMHHVSARFSESCLLLESCAMSEVYMLTTKYGRRLKDVILFTPDFPSKWSKYDMQYDPIWLMHSFQMFVVENNHHIDLPLKVMPA